MQVSVALAHSNPLILVSLSELFEQDGRFSLVSTANTAEAFLGTAIRVPVDICVIGWELPQMGGKGLIETLREIERPPRVIVYGSPSKMTIRQAMLSGAAGFCAQDHSAAELLDICVSVANGKMVFPYTDLRAVESNPLDRLTPRELKLLETLSRGLTNRQLAREFDISENTVKFHLSNIYDKIGARNRAQAVGFYMTLKDEFIQND